MRATGGPSKGKYRTIKRFAKAVMTLAEYPPPSWGPQIKRDIDDVVDEAARINAGGRI